MTSFDFDFEDEKSRAGSEFMFRISQELQRVFLTEKKSRKITQQAIAEKLETSRSVINRQLQGLENIGARRIGELFWAMGWVPHFEARPIPAGINESLKPQSNEADKPVAVEKKKPEQKKPVRALTESGNGSQQGEASQHINSLAQDNAYLGYGKAALG